MLQNLSAQLKSLTLESTKIRIVNYCNNYNQVSNFEITFVNYSDIVVRSLAIWNRILPSQTLCLGHNFSVNDLNKARQELIDSYQKSLSPKGNPYYTCSGIYLPLKDKNDQVIYGCKWHQPDSTLHLEGLTLSRQILSPGGRMPPESSSLTLAKCWLKARTPLNKWCQFRLSPNQFKEIRALNLNLSDRDLILHCLAMKDCAPMGK